MNGSARVFKSNAHHALQTGVSSDYHKQNNTPILVSARPSSSPYLEARLLNLEEQHGSLRSVVDKLAEMCHSLYNSVDKLNKGGWPVHVGPSQEPDPPQSRQNTLRSREELNPITHEVHISLNNESDRNKANGECVPKTKNNVPSHLSVASTSSNGTSVRSVPPHLRDIKKTKGNTINGYIQQNPNKCVACCDC